MGLSGISPKRVLLVYPLFNRANMSYYESVQLMGKKAGFPPLGLVTVAALLPPQWTPRLVDLNVRAISEEEWAWAEIIMVGGMGVQLDNQAAVVREAKQRGKIVVTGGPSSTSLTHLVLESGCDFLVKGEAEGCIDQLVAAVEGGRGDKVLESRERPNMEISPLPRFDLLDLDAYIYLTLQTTRGCPFDCEFCDIVSLFGRIFRYKAPDQVIRELQAIYDLGWRGLVFVCDDNFIGSSQYTRRLMEKWIPWSKAHGEPFSFYTQASINLGRDPEMIDLLTEANFSVVCVGIESPEEENLKTINKKVNLKSPLASSLMDINKNGLTTVGSFLIGIDGEKAGAGDRICAFAEQTNIPTPVVNVLQAHPNSRLWHRLEKEGRLKANMFGTCEIDLVMNFTPTRPERDIVDEYHKAWDYLYEPSRFLTRIYRNIMTIRPTRKALAKQKEGAVPDSEAAPARIPYKLKRAYIVSIIRMSWVFGVKADCRWLYWKYMYLIWRKNPTRLPRYFFRCGEGVSFLNYRKNLKARVAAIQREGCTLNPGPGRV